MAQPSGNRLTQVFDTSTGLRSNPTYDAMNRLQSIMYQNLDCSYNSTMSWTYDRYGNRWTQSVSGGNSSAAQPSLTFDMTTNHIAGATYDAAGNMIQDPSGNTYTYDADGNLTGSSTGIVTTSTYDALNHRVAYQAGGTTTLFAFNPAGQRSAIYDGAENLLQNQIYWGATPVAFLRANTLSYQFQNWVGTEVFNVAPSSSQTQYASNPFGDGFTTTSGSDSDPLHYAGLDGDSDGTMHASYRNYNPTQAQWLSPDPSYGSYRAQNPQSFNRYAYVKNNPLSRNDPSGLDDGSAGDNGNPCDNADECEVGGDDTDYSYDDSGGDSDAGEIDQDPYHLTVTVTLHTYDFYNPSYAYADTSSLWFYRRPLLRAPASSAGITASNSPQAPAKTSRLLPYPSTSVLSSQHNHDECVNGAVVTTVGVLATVGAAAVIVVAAPEVAGAAALEETAGETALTFLHGADALGHLLVAPLFAVGVGTNMMAQNCGHK